MSPNAISIGGASGEDRRTGWRTDATGGVALGKLHSLGGEFVHVWGFDEFIAVGGGVAPAHVID